MQNLLDTIKKYFSSVYADSKTLNEAMELLNKTYSDIANNMNDSTKKLYESVINAISAMKDFNFQLALFKKNIEDTNVNNKLSTATKIDNPARLLLDPKGIDDLLKISPDATKVQQAKTAEQIAKDAQEARKKEVELIKEKIDNYRGLITEIKGASEKFLGANNAVSKLAGKALSVVDVLGGFEKTYNSTVETFEKLRKLKLSDFNIFTLFKKQQTQIDPVYNAQGHEIAGPPVSLKTPTTKIKALDVLGSLYAAADLGFSSYGAGRQSGAMGILGSTVSGLASGAAIGSIIPFVGTGIGATIGGAIGGTSGLLGWLFGGGARKLQRELTTIGQIDKMVQANVNALSNRTNQLASTAGSGNFLDELQGQIGQIQEQIGYISGQEVYAQQIYNPSQYKKAGAKQKAQDDLNAAMSSLSKQKAELANAMNAVTAAIAKRKQEITQGGQDLTMALDELIATNTNNISLGIDTKLFEEDLKSVAELNSNLYNWHDSPENMAIAQQIREQQLIAMGKERKLAWVTAQKEAELFAQKMAEADLYAQNDGNPDAVAIAKFNKEKAIKDLELEVQQLMIQYENDTEKLVELAKYRADRMTAIAAEEQEAIENSLTKTATELSGLLDQYDATATQFDFQRKKTQEESKEEDLEKIRADLREKYPEFMAMLDSIGTDNPIKVDSSNFFDSLSFSDALGNISKHKASNTWNNVINIDVQGNNAQDLAESINMQLKKLLDDQKRFTNW